MFAPSGRGVDNMDSYAKRFTQGARSYFGAGNQMGDASTFAPDNASLEKELVQYLLSVSHSHDGGCGLTPPSCETPPSVCSCSAC